MERAVVTARVVGVPHEGLAVWVATDDPDVAGDLDPAPAGTRPDDLLVLDVERHGFRWVVTELVEHLPARRPPTRPATPHAHPSRPPGAVVIAWFPFTREDDAAGKHRPCVVLRSTDPSVLRVRPLYDAGSAHARRTGGVPLHDFRAAGLDKRSVAVTPVEVPVARVEQTIGTLTPHDQRRLGLPSPANGGP